MRGTRFGCVARSCRSTCGGGRRSTRPFSRAAEVSGCSTVAAAAPSEEMILPDAGFPRIKKKLKGGSALQSR